MKKHNRILLTLLAASLGLAGLAGVAAARGDCPGGGYGGAAMNPEVRDTIQKAHTAMAPVFMELQAKKQELTAKIYGGADENTIKGLISEINTLQGRLTEAGASMHQQLAKAGVPLNAGMMNCPAMGARGYYDQGQGWKGHGGPRPGGHGFHGGGCPNMQQHPNMQHPNAQ